MGPWVIRIANAAFFTVCCYQLAQVSNGFVADWLSPTTVEVPKVTARSSAELANWEDRRVILDRNLFAADIAGGAVPEDAPTQEDLEDTNLPLRLLGTLAAAAEENASAAIENRSARQTRVYRLGDPIEGFPNVTLELVERKRVILLNGGQREALEVDDEGPRQVASARKRPSRRSPSRTASRSRGTGGRLAERLKEIQTRGSGRTASELFSQAKIVPKYEDGSMVGVELNSIVEGSLYEKLGLEDGNVITELNGIEINNAGASAKALQALADDDEITITVDGDERTFTADDLAEFFED